MFEATAERIWIQNALTFAREHQSSLTGFIHYSFEEGEVFDTIPLFENICFVLALMRSHVVEKMQEAKELLDKLLYFQSDKGAFPVYLHQFPKIEKPLHNVAFLIPLWHIHDKYKSVLGKELAARLTTCMTKLYNYVQSLENLPPILAFQKDLFAFCYYGGEKPILKELPLTSKEYADVLSAVQMIDYKLSIPWNQRLKVFAGEIYNELTFGFKPRKTLVDLYYHPEEKVDQPVMLYGAMLFTPPPEEVRDDRDFLMSAFDSYDPKEGKKPPGLQLFRVVFGEHVLSCAEWDCKMETKKEEDATIFSFTYPTTLPQERGELFELKLFVNYNPPLEIRVAGEKANTFQLGEEVTLTNEVGTIRITFTEETKGARLFGHLIRGNRNGQTCKKVKKDHAAYDWGIVLRTVHREALCKVRLKLIWHPKKIGYQEQLPLHASHCLHKE